MFSLDETTFDILYPGERAQEAREFAKRIKLHNILDINRDITNQYALIIFYNDFYTEYKSLIVHIVKIDVLKHGRLLIDQDIKDKTCKYITTIILNQSVEIFDKYYIESFDLESIFNQLPIEPDLGVESVNESIDSEGECESIDSDDEGDSIEIVYGNLHPTSNENITYEEKDAINFDIQFFYDNFFVNCNDLSYMSDYIDYSVNLISNEFHNCLENVGSGLWFNLNDIRWQYSLRSILITNTFTNDLQPIFSHKSFEKGNLRDFYFNNYIESCIYNQKCYESLTHLKCIDCNMELEKIVYNNVYCGNLCTCCYIKTINKEEVRQKYLKKMLLLAGKISLFRKEVIKTREFLKHYEIKPMSIEHSLELNKRVNKELMKYSFENKNSNYLECSICLDNMEKNNIAVGFCGHSFHINCIDSVGGNKCPICRCYSKFIKLYI